MVAALLLVVLISGTAIWNKVHAVNSVTPGAHQVQIKLGDTVIVSDIADTEVLREQGLSGRAELSEKSGMLFVFPQDGEYAFWMKDMLFSIDIIWLTQDKKVVYIVKDAKPESYPSSFVPSGMSRYVIEVPAGWTMRHQVTVGSVATF